MKITEPIRKMIGNYGEPLELWRPVDANGYDCLESWESAEISAFAIVDHSGWARDLCPMTLDPESRTLEQLEPVEHRSGRVRPARDELRGRIKASLKFEQGPGKAIGLLIRITTDGGWVHYFTAAFGEGRKKVNGQWFYTTEPPIIEQGNTLTTNYSLDSHGSPEPEPYHPCEDLLYHYPFDYYG